MLTYSPDTTKAEIFADTLLGSVKILNSMGTRQLSTKELADTLLPEINVRGVMGITIKQWVYKALAYHATRELEAYCTKGQPIMRMGKSVRPWLWHTPKQRIECSECGHLHYK